MNNYWAKIGEKIYCFIQWCFEKYPGRFVGFLIGFFLALMFLLFGFLQTVILIGLSYLGYYLGKCWDEGEVPPWLDKLVHKISFKHKR